MTTTRPRALTDADTRTLDCYWRAANYLAVGQIYLMANPLLTSRCGPSTSSRGCWGTGVPAPASTSSGRT